MNRSCHHQSQQVKYVSDVNSIDNVDMEHPVRIWEYCVHGLVLPADDDFHSRYFVNTVEEIALDNFHLRYFVNAVEEITSDMN